MVQCKSLYMYVKRRQRKRDYMFVYLTLLGYVRASKSICEVAERVNALT